MKVTKNKMELIAVHVAKYQASACGNMLNHYERSWSREDFERVNVEKSKTEQNWNCRQSQVEPIARIKDAVKAQEQMTGRKVRKDAVRMADVVVTLPPNVPESDLRAFFELTTDFLEERTGGRENCLGAYVHMDETTPHLHYAFIPIVEGRFNAKKMLNRQWFKTLHDDLQEYLTRKLGYMPAVKDTERIMPNVDLKDVSKMKQIENELKELRELQGKGSPSRDDLLILKGKLETKVAVWKKDAQITDALAQVEKMIKEIDEKPKPTGREFNVHERKQPVQEVGQDVEGIQQTQEHKQPTSLKDRARQATVISEQHQRYARSSGRRTR